MKKWDNIKKDVLVKISTEWMLSVIILTVNPGQMNGK